jgi:hypothetical protein
MFRSEIRKGKIGEKTSLINNRQEYFDFILKVIEKTGVERNIQVKVPKFDL